MSSLAVVPGTVTDAVVPVPVASTGAPTGSVWWAFVHDVAPAANTSRVEATTTTIE
jgi:hypothetical protein